MHLGNTEKTQRKEVNLENNIPLISIKDGLEPLLRLLERKSGPYIKLQTDIELTTIDILKIIDEGYANVQCNNQESNSYTISR